MRKIILVKDSEIEKIELIYKNAREFMKLNNNPNQWGDSHPSKELLLDFINKKVLYKIVNDNDEILGVFAFIIGIDPTYIKIDGKWINDSKYGVIHALSSSYKEKGVFNTVLEFSKSKINHIRIDTHEDNLIMQKLILDNGFKYCGIIKISNGDPRLAYEYIKEE